MRKPIKRILIANRGEIAVRVNRTCRDMGIETVQVYSEADRDSLAVRLADRAVCIGPPHASKSYLDQKLLVHAAAAFKADAVHPGYGFLSENARFAEILEEHSVHFIGPKPAHIRLMGDKIEAKRLIHESRFFPLLNGARGRPKLDVAALAKLVSHVSKLAISEGRILSLDLNPVLVTESGAQVVDFKIEYRE